MCLHDWRVRVGGFGFVGVDLAIVFGVERAVLGIETLGSHGEDKVVFLALEACCVVPAIGIHHPLVEVSGVNQLGERCGVVAVVFVEQHLGAYYDPRVSKCGEFGVRAGGIAAVLGLVR